MGKRSLQPIERKHLTLRTQLKRWARQPLCCSRALERQDVVSRLFTNRDECGRTV
jgi:insertion element IS1 protein InsB